MFPFDDVVMHTEVVQALHLTQDLYLNPNTRKDIFYQLIETW